FFGVIASLTHTAAVVVCAIYFVVYYVTASDERSNRYKILYVVMGSAAISILYLLVYYATFTNYEELDDRGSGILFKLL
ncbi:hypothetical protein, partial [Pseudoalteromonas sp. GW168-MNA-CIBAN-0100]|uniref:hypothetical protein n=1 Tax=Pseudoalteromonas sp. GW168-MNA-CIBAN-0100 TaxID=3140434 RepID=UPI003329733F